MRRSPLQKARAQSVAIALTGLSSIAWVPGLGSYYPRFACTLLAGAAWLCVWAYGALQKLDARRRPFFVGLGVAAVAVVASSLASRFPELAISYGGSTGVSGAYWLALICALGAGARVTLSHQTSHVVRWQFLWAAPVAIGGIVQVLLGGKLTFGYENVDLFAPMMLLFAPLALGFAAAAPDARSRRSWTALACLFAAAVLATRTMAGFVGLAAEVLIAAWFAPGLLGMERDGVIRKWTVGVLAVGAASFMLFGSLYLADVLPAPAERFATQTLFGRSAVTRVEMWRVAARELRSDLWLGVGPDQYAFEGQRYFSDELHLMEHYPDPDQELPLDPHSLLVLLAVDFGLLGVAALTIVAVTWARDVLRGAFATDRGHVVRWSYAVAALGFGYAALFVPFPLVFGAFPVFVAGLALVGPSSDETREDIAVANPRWVAAGLAVVLACYLGYQSVSSWAEFTAPAGTPMAIAEQARRAELHEPQVAFYRFVVLWQQGRLLARSDHASAVAEYHRAVETAPSGVRDYAPYLVELVRLSLDDAVRSGRTDVSWERAQLARAMQIAPSLPETEVEMIHLELAANDVVAARAAARRAERWRGVVPELDPYLAMLREAESSQ